MEAAAWDDLDHDLPCLARDSRIEAFPPDAPADRLYCRLVELDEGDEE